MSKCSRHHLFRYGGLVITALVPKDLSWMVSKNWFVVREMASRIRLLLIWVLLGKNTVCCRKWNEILVASTM